MLIHRDINRICGYPYNHSDEKCRAHKPNGYNFPCPQHLYGFKSAGWLNRVFLPIAAKLARMTVDEKISPELAPAAGALCQLRT